MLRLFSSNSNCSNTEGAAGLAEKPLSRRGATPGVIGERPVSGGLFGSLSTRQARGRSSFVQGSVAEPNVLGLGFTDEPPSLPSPTGTSGRVAGRGRCVPTEAVTRPPHNEAQASARRLTGRQATKRLKSEDNSEIALATKAKRARNIEIPQDASYEQVAKGRPTRSLSRRYCPGRSSATTPDDRFPRYPLRIGTHPPLKFESATNGERPESIHMPTMHEIEAESSGESKIPLISTLYDGSYDISSTPHTPSTTSTLHLLAVGVDYNEAEDPQHDLDLLTTLFGGYDPEQIRFRGISGEEATREIVEEAIGELYREALKSPDSNALILFTGDGDEDNRMHLLGGEFITDKDLRRWIWKLQIACHPNNRTVTIILDHCRTNPNIPVRVSHVGVEFIWSCSLGQRAVGLNLKLGNTCDVPRSLFLLALMRTSYYFPHDKGELAAAVDHEVHLLLRCCGAIGRAIHKSGRCPCTGGRSCPAVSCPQEPDWQQAGSMRSIYAFVDRLSKMDVVPKVYDLVTRDKYFREANGVLDGAGEEGPPHQNGTAQHNRGSSRPIHATLNIQPEPQPSRKGEAVPAESNFLALPGILDGYR